MWKLTGKLFALQRTFVRNAIADTALEKCFLLNAKQDRSSITTKLAMPLHGAAAWCQKPCNHKIACMKNPFFIPSFDTFSLQMP
jgi:hypothetical protein